MAVPVSSVLSRLLNDVPEHYLEKVIYLAKINETTFFKKYCMHQGNRVIYRDFILSLFNADRAVIQTLYKKIEYVLMIAGCTPGLGIAFNVIDAIFCYLLGNWFGTFIAILSCFPIPGFKVAGKGLEKFLTTLIKKIPVEKIVGSFTRQLGKRIELLKSAVNSTPYVTIQSTLRQLVSELNNPFAKEVMVKLNKVIAKFGPRLEEKEIGQSIKMSSNYKFGNILTPGIIR